MSRKRWGWKWDARICVGEWVTVSDACVCDWLSIEISLEVCEERTRYKALTPSIVDFMSFTATSARERLHLPRCRAKWKQISNPKRSLFGRQEDTVADSRDMKKLEQQPQLHCMGANIVYRKEPSLKCRKAQITQQPPQQAVVSTTTCETRKRRSRQLW